MRASQFDVRRYRSRTALQGQAAEPPTGTGHAPLLLSVTVDTTRDAATLLPPTVRTAPRSRTRSRLSHGGLRAQKEEAGACRVSAEGRSAQDVRTWEPCLLVPSVAGCRDDPRPWCGLARACVLGKRGGLAETCFDLGFSGRGCVSHNTLTCGNVSVVPQRHPYLPTQLVQVWNVAGGARFPGNTARIRCVGVDTKAPRQRVQICQLSLNNC